MFYLEETFVVTQGHYTIKLITSKALFPCKAPIIL